MFGLIGHLNSLEHAQAVAQELGYPEYADQGWIFAVPRPKSWIQLPSPALLVRKLKPLCRIFFLPEMLANIKAATHENH